MHVELPKAKKFKEFSGEYLMIVISIVTALGLEHAVQSYHHRHLAHEASARIEVAAEAIVWAATHRRREIYVGLPTALTVVLNKAAPGLLDKLMARHAYEQQFLPEQIPADRPDNLFHAVPSPYRAHGRFDERAHASSPQLWTSLHRDLVGAGLALAALSALAWAMMPRRRLRR